MKNANIKKILATVLGVVLVLSMVFVISSCKKEEHVHTLKETVLTEATCTTNGVTKITCTDPECEYTETKTVSSKGHTLVEMAGQPATCVDKGYKAYKVCENCDYTTFSVDSIIEATGHDYKAATCTEPQICKVCDATFGEPNGHNPDNVKYENNVNATCTTDGHKDAVVYCKVASCKAELSRETIVLPATGHTLVHHDAQEPTCVIGWYAYDTCRKCNYSTYVEREPIRNHYPSEHPVDVVRVPATCTTTGIYYTAINCTECGRELSASEDKVSAALGHKYVDYPGQAPTCEEIGWYAYHTCSVCGDTNYTTIPETGHTWTNPDCVNPSVCSVCNAYSAAPVGHTVNVAKYDYVDPTCELAGSYLEVKTCTTCGTELSRERIVIQPLGHLLYDHLPKSPTCTEVGWDIFQSCTRCTYSTYQDHVIPALGHTGLPAVTENYIGERCTVDGSYDSVVYCSVCGEEVSRTSVVLPATGHNTYTYNVTRYNATCTSDGVYDVVTKCRTCGVITHTTDRVEPAYGHNYIHYGQLLPTCTTNGHEAYDRCSRCGVYEYGYTVIPALGHLGVVVHDAIAPTCTTPGTNVWEECTICGYSNQADMALPALGHTIVIRPAQAPTCFDEGWYAYQECDVCGAECTKDQNMRPATGHVSSHLVVENYVASTCVTDGSYDNVYRCDVCNTATASYHYVTRMTGHDYDEITGKCIHINANDGTACPSYYTPCLSFALKEDGTMAVTGTHYNPGNIEIIIPETFRGYAVTSINDRAFYNCTSITSVVIPDSVTVIGASAFYNCNSLRTIVIGSGVHTIDRSAFYRCDALATVYYHGTAAQWNAINIASTQNDPIRNANRVYN